MKRLKGKDVRLSVDVYEWPPAYSRALHAVQQLNRGDVPCVNVPAIMAHMNQSKPQDMPSYDPEVVHYVCEALVREGHLLCHGTAGCIRYVPRPSSPAVALERIPRSMGDRDKLPTRVDRESLTANTTAGDGNGKLRRLAPTGKYRLTALGKGAPSEGPVVAPGAQVVDRNGSTTLDRSSRITLAEKPRVNQSPVNTAGSQKRVCSADQAWRFLQECAPLDWFTGDELGLPPEIGVGPFKRACAALFRQRKLERTTRRSGRAYIYVYRMPRSATAS